MRVVCHENARRCPRPGPARGRRSRVAARAPRPPQPSHGLSIHGDLKYGPGFAHFAYVNPTVAQGRQRHAGGHRDVRQPQPVHPQGRAGRRHRHDVRYPHGRLEPTSRHPSTAWWPRRSRPRPIVRGSRSRSGPPRVFTTAAPSPSRTSGGRSRRCAPRATPSTGRTTPRWRAPSRRARARCASRSRRGTTVSCPSSWASSRSCPRRTGRGATSRRPRSSPRSAADRTGWSRWSPGARSPIGV